MTRQRVGGSPHAIHRAFRVVGAEWVFEARNRSVGEVVKRESLGDPLFFLPGRG